MHLVAHVELSWLLAQGLDDRRDRRLVVLAGVLPDADVLTLAGGADLYGRYHHLLTHGFLAAAATVLLCAALGRRRARTAVIGAATFHLHLACDLAGSGPSWPVFYLWPASDAMWLWAGQWDLASWQNGVIAMTATALCLGAALVVRRTVVEVFSARADRAVTGALRARFLGEPAPAPADEPSSGPPTGRS